MTNNTTERMFRAIPFPMACDLHQRLLRGEQSPEIQRMLRQALRQAGFSRRAA